MCCDDKFDEWIDHLCTCEPYSECEWHERLRRPEADRWQLGMQMDEIIAVSHAVAREEMELPDGWEEIPGRNRHYWAPYYRDTDKWG